MACASRGARRVTIRDMMEGREASVSNVSSIMAVAMGSTSQLRVFTSTGRGQILPVVLNLGRQEWERLSDRHVPDVFASHIACKGSTTSLTFSALSSASSRPKTARIVSNTRYSVSPVAWPNKGRRSDRIRCEEGCRTVGATKRQKLPISCGTSMAPSGQNNALALLHRRTPVVWTKQDRASRYP